MRTEGQLRAALHAIAERAPVADGLAGRLQLPPPASTPGPRSRRRRRALVVVTVGLALTGLAAALALQVYPRPVPEPADRRTPGHWAMVSALIPPDGWTTGSRRIFGPYETTSILDPSGKGGCAAEVNGRGVAPRTPVPGATTPVTVNGRPAQYATTPGQDAGVFWAYDEDAWASVVCRLAPSGLGSATSPAAIRDLVVRLAERVTFGDYRLLLPIRLGRLPSGYAITAASQDLGSPERWGVSLSPARVTEATPMVGIDAGEDSPIPAPTFRVGNYPASTATFGIRGGMSRVPRTEVSYTALYLRSTPVKIRLAATNTRSDDPDHRADALRRIATEADLGFAASPTDAATWFDAADALPS